MKLGLASSLESRDGTTAKDAGGRNAIIETEGEASALLKRPGAYSLGSAGTGLGQLLACYKGNLKSIVGNTLADLIVTTYLPMSGVDATVSIGTLPTSTTQLWTCVAYGNGMYLAKIGDGRKCAISTDGVNWTAGTNVGFSTAGQWDSIAYGNGLFVAMNSMDATNRYATTPDGVTWTTQTFPITIGVTCTIRYVGGLFVVVAQLVGSGAIYTSPDGINWTLRTLTGYPSGYPLFKDVTYGNGTWALLSIPNNDLTSCTISKTADFSTWSHSTQAFTAEDILHDGTKFILPLRATSTDATTWTAATGLPVDYQPECADTGNGLAACIVWGTSGGGSDQFLFGSADHGATWTQLYSYGLTNEYVAIAYGDDGFVILSDVSDVASNAVLTDASIPGGAAVAIESSQAITSIDPDLPFFAQVAGQAQSENVIVFKNEKEAWVYKT